MEKTKSNKNTIRAGLIFVIVWLLVGVLVMTAIAATSDTGSTDGNEFTWTWSTDNTNQDAAGTFTGSVADGNEEQKILTMNISANSSTYKEGSNCPGGSAAVNAASTKNTATITNNTGTTIRIVKVEATTATCDLTENRILSNGDRFSVSITANPTSDTDATSRNNSGSVTITYEAVQNVDLVYYGADGASYSYGDTLLDDATDQIATEVPTGSSITLPDAPTVTNGTFAGWRVGHIGSLFQPGAEVAITNHSSIYPVITTDGQVEPFTVSGKTYKFWTDAVAAAGADGLIVLNQNYTLPTTLVGNGVSPDGTPFISGTDGDISFIIPAGITLLIPYDPGYTLCTTAPTTIDATLVAPSAHITLNMAENTKIIVNGGLSLSGTQNAQYKSNGQPHGPLGVIKMETNSNITVNRGGALYAWGYIAGSGTVTIKSGATVYEDFQVRDYRGGDVTSTLSSGTNVSTWHIFPMSQYYVQNVQVPMTLEAGAIEFGYFSVTASLMGIKSEAVNFFGANALFNVTNGYAVKDYDEATDRLVIDLYGTLDVNPFSINIQVQGFSSAITINSANYDLPLNSNITLNMKSGSTLHLNQSLLMLPGSVINIESGAKLSVNSGKRLIVYDKDQWAWEGKGTSDGYCSDLYKDVIPLAYVYKDTTIGAPKYTRGNKDLVDGKILVNGTLDASAGYLYTTANGGNICSTGNGQVIIQSTAAANAYQIAQRRNGSDDFVQSSELDTHPITSAQLHNGDGTYDTAGNYNHDGTYVSSVDTAGTYNYHSVHKRWVLGGHVTVEETITKAPTCTEIGEKTIKCSCGYISTEELPSSGQHTEKAGDPVLPTYTTEGKTAGKICKNCGTVLEEGTTVIVANIATDEGVKEYTILSEAIAAAGDGGTVTLLSSIEKDVPVSQELTIQKTAEITITVTAINGYEVAENTNTVIRIVDNVIRLTGFSLDIEGEILLNLKFQLPDCFLNDDNAYVQVTEQYFGINEDEVREWTVSVTELKAMPKYDSTTQTNGRLEEGPRHVEHDKNGRYVFSQGIAAGEMSGNVTVEFFDGDGNPLDVYEPSQDGIEPMAETDQKKGVTRSVLKYAELAIEKAESINITDSSTSDEKKAKALGEMCKAMLTFGAYAQEFYEHRRVDPDEEYVLLDASYKNITETNDAVLSKIKEKRVYGSTDGMTLAGALLDLDSTIDMLVYFEDANSDITFDLYRPRLLDEPYKSGAIQLGSEYLELVNVPPAFWNDLYQIIPSEGSGETCTAKFCVYDWIRGCLTSGTNESEQKMAIAMYNYAEAADVYFALKYGS